MLKRGDRLADKLKEYVHRHLKEGHHPLHLKEHIVKHGHHPGVVQAHIKSYYRKRTFILAVTILVFIAITIGIFFAAQKYGRGKEPYLELKRTVYFPLASPVDKIGITSDDQFLYTLDIHGRQTQYQIKDKAITTLSVSFPETTIPVGTFSKTETDSLKCRIEEGKINLVYKPGDILLRTMKAENYTRCFFSSDQNRLFAVTDNFIGIYDLRILAP